VPTLRELRRRIEAGEEVPLDEPVEDVVLYHGFRSKLSPEEIKERGVCTFKTSEEAVKVLEEALSYFGKRWTEKTRQFAYEISRPERRVIWTTIYEDAACGWARVNPEIVYLTLYWAGVKEDDIFDYLRRRFGRPYYVETNIHPTLRRIYGLPTDISLGRTCILPEEIVEVYPCPESAQGHVGA